ncbi:hypothetical protein P8452_18707 [Trifolium repens]|nr:hypothetical protein P8452_18707 [Trifolium repens]
MIKKRTKRPFISISTKESVFSLLTPFTLLSPHAKIFNNTTRAISPSTEIHHHHHKSSFFILALFPHAIGPLDS